MTRLLPYNMRRIGFHNAMDDFFDDRFFSSRHFVNDTFKIDIREKDDCYLIDAELSGVPKENVSVDVNDDILTISIKEEQEEHSYLHRERGVRTASRSVKLIHADIEAITAGMENGVLTIEVPKLKNEQTKRTIAIN